MNLSAPALHHAHHIALDHIGSRCRSVGRRTQGDSGAPHPHETYPTARTRPAKCHALRIIKEWSNHRSAPWQVASPRQSEGDATGRRCNPADRMSRLTNRRLQNTQSSFAATNLTNKGEVAALRHALTLFHEVAPQQMT